MGKGILKKIIYGLCCFEDVIFPKADSCAVCGRVLPEGSGFMCSACASQLYLIDSFDEKIKSEYKDRYYDSVSASCSYRGLARDMVHSLKYKDKREVASAMAAYMKSTIEDIDSFDMYVPVPVSESRFNQRGYNHAGIIALELSDITGIKTLDILTRVKNTKPQILFSSSERWYNVQDAFECRTSIIGKRVILIDDVITTGATMHYCAKALKSAGASYVHAAAFAK